MKINKRPTLKLYERLASELPTNIVVAETVVDDPIEAGAKLLVFRAIRDDFLAGLKARGAIDDAQYEAGREWQEHYENSEIGGVRAIDTTKEAVDGGRFPEPITDKQRKAFKKLAEADRALGIEGCALIRQVLIERLSMASIAVCRDLPQRYGKEYLGRRLRECLETLAVLWGYAMKQSTGRIDNGEKS